MTPKAIRSILALAGASAATTIPPYGGHPCIPLDFAFSLSLRSSQF